MAKTSQTMLFNAMMSRETKIIIDGIELTWTLIEGTTKVRERAAKKESEKLSKLIEE